MWSLLSLLGSDRKRSDMAIAIFLLWIYHSSELVLHFHRLRNKKLGVSNALFGASLRALVVCVQFWNVQIPLPVCNSRPCSLMIDEWLVINAKLGFFALRLNSGYVLWRWQWLSTVSLPALTHNLSNLTVSKIMSDSYVGLFVGKCCIHPNCLFW